MSNHPLTSSRCERHRIEILLSHHSRTGKVLAKCADCPWERWVVPKDAVELRMMRLRCFTCKAQFIADSLTVKQIEFNCHACDRKPKSIEELMRLLGEKGNLSEDEENRARDLQDAADVEYIEGND